jgi:thymidylate synthase (FAD)
MRPKHYIIAAPELTGELDVFLNENGINWKIPDAPTAEIICEFAGRLCYESWDNTDNLNISRTRKDGYLANVIKQKHGSVFEHGGLVILFANVSRIFTHELVRHRAGSAFSQTSGRFVRLREIKFWIPDIISENPEAKEIFVEHIRRVEEDQARLEEIYDIDNLPFSQKKILTSAFRRIAPNGQANNILWSTNHRAMRNIIELRTSAGAEIEIQMIFRKLAVDLYNMFPNIYEDILENLDGSFSFDSPKI